MLVEAVDSFDGPTADVTVYTGSHLHRMVGRSAERNAVEVLSHAFTIGELNAVIRYDHPTQTVPERTGVCDEPFQTWNQRVLNGRIPDTAADINVLLIDGRAGGCSNSPNVDPGHCTVGATPLANLDSWNLSGTSLPKDAAHDLLHEVGHNLGYPHVPHGGYALDEAGYWYRTPTVGGNDVENVCGEHIEKRDNNPSHRYLFWHHCAIDNARLADGDPDPPSSYPPIGYMGLDAPYLSRFPTPANTDPPDDGANGNTGNGTGDGTDDSQGVNLGAALGLGLAAAIVASRGGE